MIIAKDDEAKRSKIWRIVTTVATLLIILCAAFLLVKLFMSNPLEGTWESEEDSLILAIKSNNSLVVQVPEVQEDTNVKVKMEYTIDKEEKTITIKENEAELEKVAKASGGKFTAETLEAAVSPVTTTFDYSVDQDQLTLTEREYGEQIIFVKQ